MSLRPPFQRCYGGVYLLDGAGPSLRNVERLDAGAAPMLARMMRTGMRVDLDHFKKMERDLGRDMDQLTESVRSLTGYYVNLDSGDQVSDLLFRKLGLKQAHPKMTRSNDRESVADDVLTAIQHEHPVVPQIQMFKEYSKLRGTYVIPIQELAQHVGQDDWRIYPNIGQSRVPSGRLNASKPNLLAMPSRTRRGRLVRCGFIPRKGWVMISVDESQIEPRISTHRSKDPGLMKIYENGEDIYSDFSIAAFKLPDKRYYDKDKKKWIYPGVDPMRHRRHCKICILAAFYDVTAKGLLEQMPVVCKICMMEATQHTCEHEWGNEATCDRCGLRMEQNICSNFKSYWTEYLCQDILNTFYMKYAKVLKMRREDHRIARSKAMLWSMWGRILHLGGVRSVHDYVVAKTLREAANFPIQEGAGGCLKLAMAQLEDEFTEHHVYDSCAILLQIHDELLYEAERSQAAEIAAHVKDRFEGAVRLDVPIKAGVAMANSWGELEK